MRKHIFGGRGLSRVPLIRKANFAIEKFLKGKKEDVIMKRGLTIHLDPRQSLAEPFTAYEPQSTEALEKYLRPGDVFVDVGASIGWFTLIAAKAVGKSGKVYAFEPQPDSLNLLKKNVAANHFENVVVPTQAVVANKGGTTKLYAVGGAWTWSSVFDPRKDYEKNIEANFRKDEDRTVREYEVESVRLDDVLPGKVDFLKVDVEGANDDVVRGALAMIKRNPAMKLLIEHPSEETIHGLQAMGYAYEFIDGLNGFFRKSHS